MSMIILLMEYYVKKNLLLFRLVIKIILPIHENFYRGERYKMGSEPVNVNEFRDLAKQALPKIAYDYFAGGAEGEYSLKENVEAFKRIR